MANMSVKINMQVHCSETPRVFGHQEQVQKISSVHLIDEYILHGVDHYVKWASPGHPEAQILYV